MPCDRTPDEEKKSKGPRKNIGKKTRSRSGAQGQNIDRKPPNGFLRFRSTLNEQFPSHKTVQSNEAGKLWAALPFAEKKPYLDRAAIELKAWMARNPPETRQRARSPTPSPSPTPVAGPSGWSGEEDVALPSSSYYRPPSSSSVYDSMPRCMASGSSHGGPSSLPFSSLSSASCSSASTSRSYSRPRLPAPSASSSSASTFQSRPRRPPAPSSVVPFTVPRAAPGGMGGGNGRAPMGMGGNGIFPQRPYSGVDSWAQGSAMRYPATSSAQAGPSGYGTHFPSYRNANANANVNMNASLPTFTPHSAPVPSSSGLHSAVDPLVGGSDAEIDWDAIFGMVQPSLPPAGPSQLPNHYGPQAQSGSGSSNTNANTMGLSGLTAPTSSGHHPAGPLVGGTQRDAEIDWSVILNMPSLARTPAGPSQVPSHSLSQFGSGSGSSNANANAMGLSGLMAPTPFVPAPHQPRASWSNANATGLSGLMASTPFVPTRYQQLPGGPNIAPSVPLGLGPFETPTRTSGGSSHSTTPSSADANVNGDHTGQGPSLWDMPCSFDDVVPPLPTDVPALENDTLGQERDENAEWYDVFNLDGWKDVRRRS